MNEEELLALLAMLEGEGEEDPYADPYADLYAPQGLPFIPQKTNSRDETDYNAAFNAQQDWFQMMSDPTTMALLSATAGVPLVDYSQQAEQQQAYTPTLDSLRSSSDEVLRNVAEAIDAGRSPYEIEATMREAGTYDDAQIDLAVRAADDAFREFGYAQRVDAENATSQSPLEEAYAEAGLPSPLARYGDPGYDHESLPTEVRQEDQDVLRRYDEQLAALRRMALQEPGTGWAAEALRPDWGGADVSEPEPPSGDPTASVGDYIDNLNANTAPGLLAPPEAEIGDGWQRSITPSVQPREAAPRVQADDGEGWGLNALNSMFGQGARDDNERWPGEERDRWMSSPRPRSRSAENYANAVRNNDAYRAGNRAKIVRRNRDNLDRRYRERLERSRGILANGLAAQGRTPLNDAANARQALLRQMFGI